MHIARIKVRISSDNHRTFSSICLLTCDNRRLRKHEHVQLKCICFDINILHLELSLRLVFLKKEKNKLVCDLLRFALLTPLCYGAMHVLTSL